MSEAPIKEQLLFIGQGADKGDAAEYETSQEGTLKLLKTPQLTIAVDDSGDQGEVFKWHTVKPMAAEENKTSVVGVARLDDVYLYVRNGVAYMTKDPNVKF